VFWLHGQFGIQQSVAPTSASVQVFGAAFSPGPHSSVIRIAAQSAVPQPGEVFRDCPDCAEMVVVPPGEFDMGGGETGSNHATPTKKSLRLLPFFSPLSSSAIAAISADLLIRRGFSSIRNGLLRCVYPNSAYPRSAILVAKPI
jgi:hypothetical protein